MKQKSKTATKLIGQLRQSALKMDDDYNRKTSLALIACYGDFIHAIEQSIAENPDQSRFLMKATADLITFMLVTSLPGIGATNDEDGSQVLALRVVNRIVGDNLTRLNLNPPPTTNDKVH